MEPSPSSSSRRGGVLILRSGEPMLPGLKSVFGVEEGGAATKRSRLFFTSSEELLEEEYYYDEQMPEKKRRLAQEQVDLLERSFEEENKLEPERKIELAKKLGVQPRQVAVWFQNRRARSKTKQLELDFDRLKSSYDALLAEHHCLIKDNDRLRSQVVCLTEKLEDAKSAADAGEQPPSYGGNILGAELFKTDDCLSTRSCGSGGASLGKAICSQHLVDSSGDSYFPDNLVCCFLDREDDDGCSYPPGVFKEQDAIDAETGQLCWSSVWELNC